MDVTSKGKIFKGGSITHEIYMSVTQVGIIFVSTTLVVLASMVPALLVVSLMGVTLYVHLLSEYH